VVPDNEQDAIDPCGFVFLVRWEEGIRHPSIPSTPPWHPW
jgi:hypothetical protein